MYIKNHDIKSNEILLINHPKDEQWKPTKIFREQAIAIAEENNLDLVEFAKNNDYSVCKILSFSSYLHKKKKQEKKQISSNKTKNKRVRFSAVIEQQDFDRKMRQLLDFLTKYKQVSFEVRAKRKKFVFKIPSIVNKVLTQTQQEFQESGYKVCENSIKNNLKHLYLKK